MEENTIFQMNSDLTYGRGYVYCLQFHMVFVTKYRKHIFVGEIEAQVKQFIAITLRKLDVELIAMETMPDNVHLLIACKPQHRLSDVAKVVKGNTARWLFLKHPELQKQLWGGHLWNPSYFVASVSERSYEQVKEYIENQKVK